MWWDPPAAAAGAALCGLHVSSRGKGASRGIQKGMTHIFSGSYKKQCVLQSLLRLRSSYHGITGTRSSSCLVWGRRVLHWSCEDVTVWDVSSVAAGLTAPAALGFEARAPWWCPSGPQSEHLNTCWCHCNFCGKAYHHVTHKWSSKVWTSTGIIHPSVFSSVYDAQHHGGTGAVIFKNSLKSAAWAQKEKCCFSVSGL